MTEEFFGKFRSGELPSMLDESNPMLQRFNRSKGKETSSEESADLKKLETFSDLERSEVIKYLNTKELEGVGERDSELATINLTSITLESGEVIDPKDDTLFKESFVRAPSNNPSDGTKKMYTELVTRGSTSWANVTAEDGTHFGAVVGKGDGSFKAFLENGNIFSRDDKRWHTVRPTDLGHASGYLTISEARVDAEKSKQLHESGRRTRVAIAGYPLDKITMDNVEYSGQEFIDKFANGNTEELPYALEMAVRSPFRLSELSSVVHEARGTGNLAALHELAVHTINNSAQDKEDVYRNLGEKWQSKLGNNTNLDKEDLGAFIEEYGLAYLEVISGEFASLHAGGKIHGNPHTSNTTFLAEFCDNVTVGESESELDTANEILSIYKEFPEVIANTVKGYREDILGQESDLDSLKSSYAEKFEASYKAKNSEFFKNGESIVDAWKRRLFGEEEVQKESQSLTKPLARVPDREGFRKKLRKDLRNS